MNNVFVLIGGEIQRMKKYNILGASVFVALIWIGVLYFTEAEDINYLFPYLVFFDAVSMAMLMVGVTMFFEKQEGTFKTLLVSPINKSEYILSKVFANIISNILTLLLLYLYARIFKQIDLNILGLLGAVILVAFFHSLLGVILTYYSKDFTDLLMKMVIYSLILMFPVILEQVGIISGQLIDKLLYAIPTKASMSLFLASTGLVETWEIYLSTAYMVTACVIMYIIVSKKFDEFAVKGSGV